MRTQTGLIGRFALYALFGSSIAFSACGDDSGSDPAPVGGSGGKASGGTAGIKATGGTVSGGSGGTTGGAKTTGGTTAAGSPSTGGTSPEAGAGGTSGGAAGEAGEAGAPVGGAPVGGAGGEGGEAGGAGGTAGEGGAPIGGAGGEGGSVDLGDVYHVYVGCADSAGSVELYYIERGTGVITPGREVSAGSALTSGAFGPDEDRLYVSHQSKGLITTFERDLENGELSLRSTTEVPYDPDDGAGGEGGGGPGPNPGTQSLTVHPEGDYLYAANYSASNVYAFALQNDGDVGDLLDSSSDGSNPQHAIVSRSGLHVLVPYSGSDEIAVYDIDNDGDLNPADDPVALAANTSPRHLALHPNGDWVYSVNQESGTVSFLTFDDGASTLVLEASVPIVPPGGYTGDPDSMTLVIGENGNFLYVANQLDGTRDGSINIFRITPNGETAGELTLLASGGTVSSQGELLRDIAISPDGNVLVAVNEGSDNLALFNVNANGALASVSTRAVCNAPYFVKIVSP